MNVLLINPPIENMVSTNIPEFVDTERGYNPPLGIMYVASYAAQHTDHKIDILDMVVEETGYDRLEDEIRNRRPDVVGITATTFALIDSVLTARIVKKVDKNIKVVFGGIHTSIYPEETIRLPEVDFLVLGEGEKTFTELLQEIENYKKLERVRGIVYKQNDSIVNTGLRDFVEDLDSLPFPARRLTPYKKYYSIMARRMPVTTMITSRGCPYRCLFCQQAYGKRFRGRSPENIVEEMEECVSMGIHEILVYDDTFNVDTQRVLDICNLIRERNLGILWDIRARIDKMNKEILTALKQAGCRRIYYGVESANPRILEMLKKDITIEQAEAVIKMTKNVGIETLAYFMIGNPTETKDEILNTIKFAKRLDPDYSHFSVTMPFPATPLYELGLKAGIFPDYWRGFAANPTKEFVPQLWEENLSREELVNLLEYAYKSFYIRSTYIFRCLLKTKSIKEFAKKAKAGISISLHRGR
jgi:anaerobic magnesium-protoporphyrin IX monomethyl ester cyclase